MSTLETYTGLYLDYLDPDPADVCVEDIARALSMTCRFGGHVTRYFSVAEHAVNVAHYVENVTGDPLMALAALHHDSHEAYIGDLPTPLKKDLGGKYRAFKDDIDRAVAAAIGIAPHLFEAETIKHGDALALAYEASYLKKSRGLGEHWGREEEIERPQNMLVLSLDPISAEHVFLEHHRRYDSARIRPTVADAA